MLVTDYEYGISMISAQYLQYPFLDNAQTWSAGRSAGSVHLHEKPKEVLQPHTGKSILN